MDARASDGERPRVRVCARASARSHERAWPNRVHAIGRRSVGVSRARRCRRRARGKTKPALARRGRRVDDRIPVTAPRNPGPRWGYGFLLWAERWWPRWIFRPAAMLGTWI